MTEREEKLIQYYEDKIIIVKEDIDTLIKEIVITSGFSKTLDTNVIQGRLQRIKRTLEEPFEEIKRRRKK